MKLEEMGIVGRQVKISDTAPERAGQVGHVVTMTTERLYIKFADGKKEWVSNKHIVGTKKEPVLSEDGIEPVLTEMAAKKQCDKCGKTMAANHYWYKGGWKCKKSSASSSDSEPAEKEDTDKFPHMSDEVYDKLSKAEQRAQDAKEAEWYKRKGRTGPQDPKAKDANEEAAYKRAGELYDKLTKQGEEARKKAEAKAKANK